MRLRSLRQWAEQDQGGMLLVTMLLALFWIGGSVRTNTKSVDVQAITSKSDSVYLLIPYHQPVLKADSLNPGLVFSEILESGCLFPEIVLKQAINETGWLRCRYCSLDSNNLFGFRKDTFYLKFGSWQESIWYYRDWQKKNYPDSGDYYDFLDSCGCFAQDTGYVAALKKIVIKR